MLTGRAVCTGGKGQGGIQQKRIGSAANLEALVEANYQKRLREVRFIELHLSCASQACA